MFLDISSFFFAANSAFITLRCNPSCSSLVSIYFTYLLITIGLFQFWYCATDCPMTVV